LKSTGYRGGDVEDKKRRGSLLFWEFQFDQATNLNEKVGWQEPLGGTLNQEGLR
jgi:hypothetical protein